MRSLYTLFSLLAGLVFLTGCIKEIELENASESSNQFPKDLKGKIELPNNLNHTDILVYSELDMSPIDLTNSFALAGHSVVFAENNSNNQPIYFGIPQINDPNFVLNSKETALYFSLLAFPHIRRPYYRTVINSIKEAIYTFQEVKDLKLAIENSIRINGYLNYDLIGPFIGLAIDRVIDEFDFISATMEPFTNRATWNPTYAAGGGFYRVNNLPPDKWSDIVNETSNTYTFRRDFFNTTAAVVGVRIESFDPKEGVALPLSGSYLGFIKPYYPPDLTTITGNIQNH
ncbi:hypothetical protein [Mongoliitalea lutea]|uniref:Uncharacterized protein n=1 Tax=Mongoliitalea lutea TaxID=849756 RepID=A0A8J3CVE4_9BACT|nr:hypothetical protein [Mongoliitalea lutea]GHB29456.1 hypothetical protein GCM10008106_08000 [Mongoliitalea lutea]